MVRQVDRWVGSVEGKEEGKENRERPKALLKCVRHDECETSRYH